MRKIVSLISIVLVLGGCSTGGRASTSPTGPVTGPTHTATPTKSPTVLPTVPVLGAVWAPYQKGYGTYRPGDVYNGGDPTGDLGGIVWTSWGGAVARGHGTAAYHTAQQTVAQSRPRPAQVVAFDLASCKGKLAYREIYWWFPQYGERFDPTQTTRNICDGGAPFQPFIAGTCPNARVLTQSLFADGIFGQFISMISCAGHWTTGTYDRSGNTYPGTWHYVGGRWKTVDRAAACASRGFPRKLHWICVVG